MERKIITKYLKNQEGFVQSQNCGNNAYVSIKMNNRLQSAHDVDFVCHEFVEGWDLNHWLINFGPIGEQLGSYFVKDLFSYVSYLHQNNISHNNFFNKSILICQNSF